MKRRSKDYGTGFNIFSIEPYVVPLHCNSTEQNTVPSLNHFGFTIFAMARTGNVPTPLNFGGMALNKKPSCGNKYKLHKCSTIKISAPKSVVCTGLLLPFVLSILWESIPTNFTLQSLKYSAASFVKYG